MPGDAKKAAKLLGIKENDVHELVNIIHNKKTLKTMGWTLEQALDMKAEELKIKERSEAIVKMLEEQSLI